MGPGDTQTPGGAVPGRRREVCKLPGPVMGTGVGGLGWSLGFEHHKNELLVFWKHQSQAWLSVVVRPCYCQAFNFLKGPRLCQKQDLEVNSIVFPSACCGCLRHHKQIMKPTFSALPFALKTFRWNNIAMIQMIGHCDRYLEASFFRSLRNIDKHTVFKSLFSGVRIDQFELFKTHGNSFG